MKGLRVGILEDRRIGAYSNNGISEACDEVTLVEVEGVPVKGPFEPSDEAPAVKIESRIIMGKKYYYAVPMNDVSKGHVGWMFGGGHIYTSDSRFPFDHAIKLHDRQESSELYDSMFN